LDSRGNDLMVTRKLLTDLVFKGVGSIWCLSMAPGIKMIVWKPSNICWHCCQRI
jgi:hypothetical protein